MSKTGKPGDLVQLVVKPWDKQAINLEPNRGQRMSKELSLPEDIRQVAAEMKRLAIRMKGEAGFAKTTRGKRLLLHGCELEGAACIAIEWANELEKETEK
jgi:hypothetical protein